MEKTLLPKKVRQGDLLFEPVPKGEQTVWRIRHLDTNRVDISGYRRDGVIQEGEATGHHHKIADLTAADVFRPSWGNPMIVVGSLGAQVLHGGSTEVDDRFHAPVTLEPNTVYEVKIAREEDPTGEIRQVID